MNVTAGPGKPGRDLESSVPLRVTAHPSPGHRPRTAQSPPGPRHLCTPEGCCPAPEPGCTGCATPSGRLISPHPLSLASPHVQAHGGAGGRGSLSPGHAPLQTSRRHTCSGARGRHGHRSRRAARSSCRRARSPASSARVPPPWAALSAAPEGFSRSLLEM